MEFCQSEKVGTLNVDIHTYYMRAVDLSCFVLMTCRFKYIYRPQRSCGQGNIFTPVCHSVHRGEGGSASVHAGIPPPDTRPPPPPGADTLPPPWTPDPPDTRPPLPRHQTPPWTPDTPHPPDTRTPPSPGKQTPAYGLRAAVTHPTGMHSCFDFFSPFWKLFAVRGNCYWRSQG